MNKTLNINLAGLIFHIDEDAFHRLERYLEKIKRQFSSAEGGQEIIADIEGRIAELFNQKISDGRQVINMADVDEVISIMGEPEDYLDEEEKINTDDYEKGYGSRKLNRKVFRDPDDKILGGVASGLSAYFDIDALWIRLLFVIFFFMGGGLIAYIILWIVIPKATSTAQKLQMRGESVTVSNIEKSIKKEIGNLGDSVKDFSQKARDYDYSKPTQSATDFFSNLFEFIFKLAKMVFVFIFKFIGFALLAVGFFALFAIALAVITGNLQMMGNEYGLGSFMDFMHLMMIDGGHFYTFGIGLALLTLAPLFIVIYLGLRIAFKLPPLNVAIKGGLVAMIFIGVIMLVTAGVRLGLEFDRHSYYTQNKPIQDYKQLYLTVEEDSIWQEHLAVSFDDHWLKINGLQTFGMVEMDIQPSPDGSLFIKETYNSKGSTRREARANAKDVIYQFEQLDSVISFMGYYTLKEGSKFRAQDVDLILYLPIGYSVYLDESMVDIIYDVDNIQDYFDYDMLNHHWEMTEKGLSCTDCPEWDEIDKGDDEPEEDETEYELEEQFEQASLELKEALMFPYSTSELPNV